MYENPSYECMRVAREESRAELLEMRRWDVSRRLKALQLPESGSHDMLSRIARVIYPTTTGWTREACEYLRDHLAELIGGERASDAQRGCAGGAGCCDCRHESEGVGGQSRTCPESGLDVSESDDGTSITSELREYLDLNSQEFTNYKDELIATISGGTSALYAIANRIDEQFARICEQQEKVLQDTIDHMQDEIDEHKEQRRVLAGDCLDYTDECWNLYDLLRDAACEYKELRYFVESIEHDVNEGRWMTLFGVNYAPVLTDYETFNDVNLINLYYKKLKRWMGEAKNLRDTLAARVEGRDYVSRELDKCRRALNEATGKWDKADAECRMYREMLNDAARDYKTLLEKFSIAFNMWVSATGGGE